MARLTGEIKTSKTGLRKIYLSATKESTISKTATNKLVLLGLMKSIP